MRIGVLATRAGVNIQTLRFYERKGILRRPPRTASGYRAYSEGDLASVMFVRRCQLVGFTLKEIQKLAPLHSSAKAESRKSIQAIARERLGIITAEIESLQRMRAQLVGLLNETDGQPDPICPFKKS